MHRIVLLTCLVGLFSGVSCQYSSYASAPGAMPANIMGSTLKVQGVLAKGFLEQSPSGGLVGFVPDLLAAMSNLSGFKYTLTALPAGSYGTANLTDMGPGISVNLFNKEIDLAATDSYVYAGRLQKIDFLTSFTTEQLRLIVKKGASLDNIRYLVQKGFVEDDLFAFATTASLKAIHKNIVDNNGYVSSVQEGINKAADGGFAFISNVRDAKRIVAADGRVEFGKVLMEFPVAFGVQQGSAWRQPLSIALATLNSQGVLAELIDKWEIRNP